MAGASGIINSLLVLVVAGNISRRLQPAPKIFALSSNKSQPRHFALREQQPKPLSQNKATAFRSLPVQICSTTTIIMGMFSYSCNKCGGKSQFDWMPTVVVKIGKDVYVRGTYDGYGRVEVQGPEGKALNVYPTQFRGFFSGWNVPEDALLAFQIYCDGSGNVDETTALMHQMVKAQANMLEGLACGGGYDDDDEDFSEEEEEEERHCVPDVLTILDELTEEIVASVPKHAKYFKFLAKKAAKAKTENNDDAETKEDDADTKPSPDSSKTAPASKKMKPNV